MKINAQTETPKTASTRRRPVKDEAPRTEGVNESNLSKMIEKIVEKILKKLLEDKLSTMIEKIVETTIKRSFSF